MPQAWIPDHDKTRETENGSTVSFMDHKAFKDIGKLAHELGEHKRHGERYAHLERKLNELRGALEAELEPLDQVQVFTAVEGYVHIAETHPEGDRICDRDFQHQLAPLEEGGLYYASGLAADLRVVCP